VLDLVSTPTFDPRYVPELHYSRMNEHYRGAVEWARLILRFASVEIRHGRAVGTTIMFDMDAVFEDFVRVALREELGLTEREFPSGKRRPDLYLDRDGHVALRPDLSWWTGTSCRFIGDVKYKRVNVAGVTHPDVYQLLAYATASGLRDGLLVYAAGEGEPEMHEIPLAAKRLHVRSLELGGDLAALRAEVRTVAAEIRRLAAAAAVNATQQGVPYQPTT
jgi:5-methylcytosine-specific restriction enzyme subunit McrC